MAVASKMDPASLGNFVLDLRRWAIPSVLIGILTAFSVLIIDILTTGIWDFLYGVYLFFPYLALVLPASALFLVGLILRFAIRSSNAQGTEEVVRAYNLRGARIDTSSSFQKGLAAILTIGFGGSAGLEGSGIHAGGSVGVWLSSKLIRLPGRIGR